MTALSQFIARLEQVPWFQRLGKPSIRDNEVYRIFSWEVWPGPEDPGASLQSNYHQKWRDALFHEDSQSNSEELSGIWAQIHGTVFEVARQNVPYYDEKDAWYG